MVSYTLENILTYSQFTSVYQNSNLLAFLGMDELILFKKTLDSNKHLNSQSDFTLSDQTNMGPNNVCLR